MSGFPTIKEIRNYFESLLEEQEIAEGKPGSNQETKMEGQNNNRQAGAEQLTAAILNGMGVGLLLGLLLGLAVSPVVSGVIGTVSSLLVVMLGLNSSFVTVVKGVRIGSFGIFAVIGILGGMFIRSHNPIAPQLSELKNEYLELGFTEKEALDFIALQEFGLNPETRQFADVVGDTSTKTTSIQQLAMNKRANVLFSSEINVDQCYLVESANEGMPFNEIVNSFTMAGGTWQELAESIDPALPESIKTRALLAIRDTFCGYGTTGTISLSDCGMPMQLTDDDSLEVIRETLADSDDVWKEIIHNIDQKIEKREQKGVFLSFINILCHE
jgi:hypothetical protein